jgi:hypothetical protein
MDILVKPVLSLGILFPTQEINHLIIMHGQIIKIKVIHGEEEEETIKIIIHGETIKIIILLIHGETLIMYKQKVKIMHGETQLLIIILIKTIMVGETLIMYR